jgi:hypothetical protein
MASASQDQRRPGVAVSANLIWSGVRMRLRLGVPRSAPTVRAAVGLMYVGAAITALGLFISIASVVVTGHRAGRIRLLGHSQPLPIAVAVGVASGVILITLWLWMARANGHGRNRARILSTLLMILATLHLFGNKGAASVVFAVVTWLVGLVAVWLLWRPASNAYFKANDLTSAAGGARPSPRSN